KPPPRKPPNPRPFASPTPITHVNAHTKTNGNQRLMAFSFLSWMALLAGPDAGQFERNGVGQRLAAGHAVDRPPGDFVRAEAGQDVDRLRLRTVGQGADRVQHPAVAVADPQALALAAVVVKVPGTELAPLAVEADLHRPRGGGFAVDRFRKAPENK